MHEKKTRIAQSYGHGGELGDRCVVIASHLLAVKVTLNLVVVCAALGFLSLGCCLISGIFGQGLNKLRLLEVADDLRLKHAAQLLRGRLC